MLPALANHIRLCLEQIAHILEENQPQHRVLVFCGRYRPPQGVGSFPEGVFELLVGYVVPSLVAAVSSATGFKGYPLRFSELFNVTRETPKCWATSVLVICGSLIIAAALRTSVLDMVGFRPPFRPLALAAARPGSCRKTFPGKSLRNQPFSRHPAGDRGSDPRSKLSRSRYA